MNRIDPPDSNPAHTVGETLLGRFRVERILGHGGMGEVLLARDTLLDRRVALKRLRPGGEAGGRRSAMLKEARRASQVNDRRIAAIHDVLELDDDLLLVMEYVDGITLRARMKEPVPIAEFWRIAGESAGAVAAAHAHGVIHRDIKPENLMLTGNGQIKVLDFGIARRADAPAGGPTGDATTMTAEGRPAMIAGTPQYMAPEALYGGRIDARTDIFSLGTVFYELLAGENPFAARSFDAVLERVMTLVPPSPRERNPEVSEALAGVIARMMAKDPAQRIPSCDEVVAVLEEARLGQAPAPAGLAARPAARGKLWPRLRRFSFVAAIAALAGGGWATWRAMAVSIDPERRNLAVLAPVTPGASEEFAAFSVGAMDRLAARLRKHQEEPGVQVASFQTGLDEHVGTAADARKVLGTDLAAIATLEQRPDAFRARLELWDTARGRRIAAHAIEAPVASPFEFLDRVYREFASMLRLRTRAGDAGGEIGVRGAGTLRFLLQGIGRLRSAARADQARRAADDLELACRTEPDAPAALAWLATAELRSFELGDSSRIANAEAAAREAVRRDSTRVEGQRILGRVLLVRKENAGALAALQRAFALDPTDDDTPPRLGSAYRRAGAPEKERELFLSVIARRPHCWQPYWWLANWHHRRGNVDTSIDAYRQMVRSAPVYDKGYANLGGLLVLRGDYAAAIDTLKRSVALRPTKVAFDNLGTAYFNSGRLDAAVDAYNQAFQFGFAEYDEWLNLGDAYYWLRNRHDQALQAYTQSVRLGRERLAARARIGNSFDAMTVANLSTVFPKLGQPDSARVYMARALAADSANPMVQMCAAITCRQLGDSARANAWLARAVEGGYPVPWLRDSPVFQEWRRESGFQSLIAGAGTATGQASSPN
ncbi:MAG TPA: serine/threonine-protein kinase [Candidatus Eisenbacteria bacterium]|nr:serine/threonine-protein kinase [Candidatus Eisenbacteria bacterium]